jgi:poly [ADP-ribose] polymerase 6/8
VGEEPGGDLCEEDELIVLGSDGDDDDIEFVLDAPAPDPRLAVLQAVVITYSAFVYIAPATISPSETISLSLPRSLLPLSMQAVYGFTKHDNFLDLQLRLRDFDWTAKPESCQVSNPEFGITFIGLPLIQTAINDFFTPTYSPRDFYRSETYLLTPTGTADPAKLAELKSEGYDEKKAERALILCANNKETSITFLRTGDIPPHQSQIQLPFPDCPLLYLVLEILECFVDLSDHCCICRAPLEPGLRPSVCSKQLCQFQFTDVGIGNSVIQEIRADPLVADLMVSIFSSAVKTKYLTPAPAGYTVDEMLTICEQLPAMAQIIQKCTNDKALASVIGAPAVQLLRWILLSNRSHLLSLPDNLRLREFGTAKEFMTLISTPGAEREFQTLKEKFGGMFLFHGSEGCRWHSIIRNGLKNASGTEMQANGAVLGAGIYFARSSETSQGYSKESINHYERSSLGRKLKILAICEVARDPTLSDHDWAHTLQNEHACIVRFLLVNGSFRVNLFEKPITKIPKLKEVLNLQAGGLA